MKNTRLNSEKKANAIAAKDHKSFMFRYYRNCSDFG
jgi:hypothetical protein